MVSCAFVVQVGHVSSSQIAARIASNMPTPSQRMFQSLNDVTIYVSNTNTIAHWHFNEPRIPINGNPPTHQIVRNHRHYCHNSETPTSSHLSKSLAITKCMFHSMDVVEMHVCFSFEMFVLTRSLSFCRAGSSKSYEMP